MFQLIAFIFYLFLICKNSYFKIKIVEKELFLLNYFIHLENRKLTLFKKIIKN